MLAFDDVKNYLASLGVQTPDEVIKIIIEQVGTVSQCLEDNYGESTAKLISLYTIGVLSVGSVSRTLKSRSAPGGSSETFDQRDSGDVINQLMTMIRQLDTKGCTASMLPTPKTDKPHGGLWIGRAY